MTSVTVLALALGLVPAAPLPLPRLKRPLPVTTMALLRVAPSAMQTDVLSLHRRVRKVRQQRPYLPLPLPRLKRPPRQRPRRAKPER